MRFMFDGFVKVTLTCKFSCLKDFINFKQKNN